MRLEFAASVAKDPAADELNEDCYLFSLDRSIATVSDGASESFDSRSWAEIVCELGCSGIGISPLTIAEAASRYRKIYDPATLGWAKAAAYERGSFATLLCVRHDNQRSELEVVSVGDTVLLLYEGGAVTRKFALSEPEEFAMRPELLSTRNDLNGFLGDPQFNIKHVSVAPVSSETVALLLTDAIGLWCYQCLKTGDEEWRELLSLNSSDEFREFVLSKRANKSMRLDDTTLIRLSF
jgi:hypothetical protein